MQSVISLYNLALARLGGEQLNLNASALEDNTLGKLCDAVFPHALDMTLAAHAWSFAVRRSVLSRPVLGRESGNPGYGLAYEIPSDCVKLLGLEAGAGRNPAYVVEGRTIRCNEDPAVLAYVSRVSEPGLWPPVFADALAWALAGELASARNNDQRRQQWCYQNYKIALSAAMALDQADQNPHGVASAWNAARLGV